MAILDQSNYNQYIADGIRNSKGLTDNLGFFSGGTMPETVRSAIVNLIAESLQNVDTSIPGNIPSEIFDSVAALMLPFTPSLDKTSLVAVLRSNSVFGQIGNGIPNVNAIIEQRLGSFIFEYKRKLLEISGGIDAVLGQFGISGSLSQIVEDLTGDVAVTIRNDLLSVLTEQEVSLVSAEVVSTFLKGSGKINVFTDLPPSFATVLRDPGISDILTNVADPAGNLDLDDLTQSQRSTFAAGYVASASGTDVRLSALSTILDKTSGTIAGTIDNTDLLPSPNPFTIDADTIDADGNFISSVEELESELASATRGISEMVVHWSETFTNSNLSASQLTELTGAGDNVYHIIIRRDGSVERGLPLNTEGGHCSANNHNEFSIGVCFVGGLNVSTGSTKLYEVASSRSITRSQYNSFYQIMRVFFNQYPGGQALGHQDIDPNQEDPGFDVRTYAYNNFNKQSLYTDPFTQTAFSPSDILKKLEEIDGETDRPAALEKDPDVMEKKF